MVGGRLDIMTGRRRGPGYPADVAVLVGRANGLVRLQDLTGGSAVEYPAAHSKPPRGLGVPDEERAAAERAAAKQAIAGTVGGAAFLIQFILVWLGVWLAANGPMRVPFIRWRFHGGRLV
jgi:hypothetical protein